MATKNSAPATTVDPLAGLPVATPAAPPAAVAAPVKIRKSKTNRLTGQNLRDAVDFARKTTGYNDTSPIWKQPLVSVLVAIEAELANADTAFDNGDVVDGTALLQNALLLNRELQKRLATNQLVAAQR